MNIQESIEQYVEEVGVDLILNNFQSLKVNPASSDFVMFCVCADGTIKIRGAFEVPRWRTPEDDAYEKITVSEASFTTFGWEVFSSVVSAEIQSLVGSSMIPHTIDEKPSSLRAEELLSDSFLASNPAYANAVFRYKPVIA